MRVSSPRFLLALLLMSVAGRSDISVLSRQVRAVNEPGREKRINAISDKISSANAKVQQASGLVDSLKRFKDANPELVDKALTTIKNVGDVGAKVKAVEQHLARFAETSAVVMKGLDAVQQIHPFVGVAVMALKAAIQLELTRRENDRKVLLLKNQMLDMMDVLRSLKDVQDVDRVNSEGETVKGRMQRTLDAAATSIRDCSAVCEKYIHKKFIVKLFDGARWEGRLAAFGDMFEGHKKDFLFALSIHTAKGVDNLQSAVQGNQDQLATLVLFAQLQSPHEREIMHYIDELGGPQACLQDNIAFEELLKMTRAKQDKWTGDGPESTEMLLKSVHEAMAEDMDKALAKDRRAFDHKFEAIQETLSEVKLEVVRSSDRILTAMEKGPHDRIVDKDLYTIWKEMAWRGSVKARHFIIAVQDYFIHKYGGPDLHAVDAQTSATAEETKQTETANDGPPLEIEDSWAVKYITLAHIRPILEAFDDDGSGWISVREANTFTRNRPLSYSVVKWLAFWAAGFRAACIDYTDKIDALRVQMVRNAPRVLPCNRLLVDKYLSKLDHRMIDYLIRGVRTKEPYRDIDSDSDAELYTAFQDYVDEEEQRLKRNLERFSVIDASNTLSMILGPGRLERNIFPLLYLLLQRHANIIRLAASVRIDDQEFDDAEESLHIVIEALMDRLQVLLFNFRNQNLDPRKQFDQAYNKMYSLLYTQLIGERATLDGFQYSNAPHDAAESEEPTPDLLKYEYGPPAVPDHFYESFIGEGTSSIDATSFNGLWAGRHYYGDEEEDCHDGSFILNMTLNDDNTVVGEGKDAIGKFTLSGTVKPLTDDTLSVFELQLQTKQLYLSTFWAEIPTFRYSGKVEKNTSGTYTRFSGKWGQVTEDDEFNIHGDFWLDRSLPIVLRYREPSAEFRKSPAKARWRLLSRVVLEQVRQKMWSWSYFRERRDNRVVVVEMQKKLLVEYEPEWYMRRSPRGQEDGDFGKIRQDVEIRIPIEDIVFYRWLGQQRLRGETAHINTICDGCGGTPIGARHICLVCKPVEPTRVIDLCLNCTEKSVNAPVPGRKVSHIPTHDYLKTLRVLSTRELISSLNISRVRLATGTSKIRAASDSGVADESLVCFDCKKPVSKPCWYCVECTGGIFLCDSCEEKQQLASTLNPKRVVVTKENEGIASEKNDSNTDQIAAVLNSGEASDGDDDKDSSNTDDDGTSSGSSSADSADTSQAEDDELHAWWHILVRIKEPVSVPAATMLSVEDRLTTLEDRIRQISGEMGAAPTETRMEKLEVSVASIADRLSILEALLRQLVSQ